MSAAFRDLHLFRRGMGSLLRDFDRSFGFGPSPAEWLYDPFGTRFGLLRANPRRLSQPLPQQAQAQAQAQAPAAPVAAGANAPAAASTTDSKYTAAAAAAAAPAPASAPAKGEDRERDYDHDDAMALFDPFADSRSSAGALGAWDPFGFGRSWGGALSKVAPANEWVNSIRPISLDIVERDADYTVSADVPGMSKADLKLTVDPLKRTLTLAGERRSHYQEEDDAKVKAAAAATAAPAKDAAAKDAKADAAAAAAKPAAGTGAAAADQAKPFRRIERVFGSVSRTIALPPNVDTSKVTAKHENGVLTITLPKDKDAATKAGPQTVAIA